MLAVAGRDRRRSASAGPELPHKSGAGRSHPRNTTGGLFVSFQSGHPLEDTTSVEALIFILRNRFATARIIYSKARRMGVLRALSCSVSA
jgi:hypothetical protein